MQSTPPSLMRRLRGVAAVGCLTGCVIARAAVPAERAAAATADAAVPAPSASGRNRLLTQRYSADFIAARMLPRESWRYFPPAAERKAWDPLLSSELNRSRLASLVKEAEQLTGSPWPALSAELYDEFARTGNRTNFEVPYFERRARLAKLVLVECMEHRGRFLEEIVTGIEAICDESKWWLPAHVNVQPGDAAGRPDAMRVDLFAAETAMTLATATHLLRAELDRHSPALWARVQREVLRRVVEPVERSDTFGCARAWLTGTFNNWTPWCSSNVLGAAMLCLDDNLRIARLTFRLMTAVDRFIDHYGNDGGCDEGPKYWSNAGGSLLVFLELLHSRTDGAIDLYAEPKIAAMGRYIVQAQIAGPWFVNFADADAKMTPPADKVYRFGQRVGSEAMKSLALLALRHWRADGPTDPALAINPVTQPLLGALQTLFWVPADATPTDVAASPEVWLPDLQVLMAREERNRSRGLFLAAKGGHNAESHNHNDTGHFIVYLDGNPGIVDVGYEHYTAQTFSARRYELWFTRGLGHNAPVVNGVEQAAGRGFEATRVEYALGPSGPNLAMNLEKAYPANLRLATLRRTFALRRGADPAVQVEDSFTMAAGTGSLLVPLFAAQPAEILRPGVVAIACRPRRLLVEFDPAKLSVTIEPRPLSDAVMRANWGDQLWRLAFTTTSERSTGAYGLSFRAEETTTTAGKGTGEPTDARMPRP